MHVDCLSHTGQSLAICDLYCTCMYIVADSVSAYLELLDNVFCMADNAATFCHIGLRTCVYIRMCKLCWAQSPGLFTSIITAIAYHNGPLQMGTGGHPFCLRVLPIMDKRRSPGRCSSFIRVLPITSPGSCPLLVRGLPIHVHIYVVQAFLLFSLCFKGHSESVSYAHKPYWVPYEVQHRMYQLRKQKNCSQIII